MKKIVMIAASLFMVLAFSGSAFASTMVSEMAVTKGGQAVAQCAQSMDKGVSECAKLIECQK